MDKRELMLQRIAGFSEKEKLELFEPRMSPLQIQRKERS